MVGNRTQNFPQLQTPMVDPETGILDPVWTQFLITLFNRSGGINGNDASSFNYPTSFGTLGQFLTSSGSSAPLTWTTLNALSQLTNDIGYALLASPNFTGVPTAPTAATITNTNQIATTQFVLAQNDSPTFTGVPIAPTAAISTNTNQIATTKFVLSQKAIVAPLIDGVATIGVSPLFALQDHVHPTDNPKRNRLENSWFEVAQRGTSFTTTSGYCADRWIISTTAASATTTLANGTGPWPSRKYLTTSASVPANGTIDFAHRIESFNSFDLVGQTVTVSFYATKSTSAGTATLSVQLSYPTTVDGFGTQTTVQQINATALANNQYTATFVNLPAGVANGLQAAIRLTQTVATGSVVYNMSAAKLEIGTYPTACMPNSIEQEWTNCQRYYQRIFLSMRANSDAAGNVFDSIFTFPTMRTDSASIVNVAAGTVSNVSSQVPIVFNKNSGRFEIVATAAGDCYAIQVLYSLSADL